LRVGREKEYSELLTSIELHLTRPVIMRDPEGSEPIDEGFRELEMSDGAKQL
jgi:hypothetical protein